MKNSLGKIFLAIFILLHVELFATTYEWNASANKTSAYVGEAIYLKYICTYSDRGELYTIDFNPIGDYEDYDIKLLSETEKLIENKRVNTYEFIAFLKKEIDIKFEFTSLMKKTNKDSIKNTVLGRDNAFYEEFSVRKVKQKALHVEVLKNPVVLVGEFSIDIKKDKQEVKAYQPYHMQVSIKGNGNFEDIKPFYFKIDGVKVFASKIIKKIELTKNGYIGELIQKFAFVSSESFEVPSLHVEYLDLKTKEVKKLLVSSSKVEVKQGYVKKELLDDVDTKFEINYDYVYYVLFFISGFLVSKIKFRRKERVSSKDEVFKEKISRCKSMDEVIFLLLLKDSNKYKNLIISIENKDITSINKIKQQL